MARGADYSSAFNVTSLRIRACNSSITLPMNMHVILSAPANPIRNSAGRRDTLIIIIINPHYTRVQAGPMCELQTVFPPHPILDFKSPTYGIPPPGLLIHVEWNEEMQRRYK